MAQRGPKFLLSCGSFILSILPKKAAQTWPMTRGMEQQALSFYGHYILVLTLTIPHQPELGPMNAPRCKRGWEISSLAGHP